MNPEAKPIKPKRRWLRFSLRTFLVLVTIFLVWLGWFVNRANRQQEAVAWVNKNGGKAWYDFESDRNGKQPPSISFDVPEWQLRISRSNYFSTVVSVNLSFAKISDIAPLNGFPQLERLRLSNTQISDLEPLKGLFNLEELDLGLTQVTDIKPLSDLKKLKHLNLAYLQISDEQIEDLGRALPNCKIFH